jgi:hypothetical protein
MKMQEEIWDKLNRSQKDRVRDGIDKIEAILEADDYDHTNLVITNEPIEEG